MKLIKSELVRRLRVVYNQVSLKFWKMMRFFFLRK